MKTTKSFLREFSLILFFLLSVMACNKDVPNVPNPPDPGGNTTTPKVVVFDTTIISSKLDSIYDDGVLKFTGLSSSESPKIGDIICSAPATNAPLGFLYKVKSINKSGNTTVITTEQATIEEAIKEAEVHDTIDLVRNILYVEDNLGNKVEHKIIQTKTDLAAILSLPIKLSQDLGSNVSLKIDGKLEAKLSLVFDISIKEFSLKWFSISISPEFSAELKSGIEGELKQKKVVPLYTVNLKPFTIKVVVLGIPVPIVIYPQINIKAYVDISGKVNLMATLLDVNYKYLFGTRYDNASGFSIVKKNESSPVKFMNETSLSLSGEYESGILLNYIFKFYNQDAYVGFYTDFFSKLSTDDIDLTFNVIYGQEQLNPKMKLSYGLNIGPETYLSIFSHKIVEWRPELFTLNWDVWERGVFPEFSQIIFENLSATGVTTKCDMSKLAYSLFGVYEHGFCWSLGEMPVINTDASNKLGAVNLIGTLGKQSMRADITGLKPGTTYTVRPYFSNWLGTFYAKGENFTTLSPSKPVVTTSSPSDITLSSAKVGGNVTSAGGSNITDRGVYYSTNTVSEGTKVQIGTGTGEFSTSLSGLTPNTTYYVKAYATNSAGTSYGSILTFKTDVTVQSPTVTTTAPANITSNSATLGGNVTSEGSSVVLERGVVFATTQNPTTSNTKIASGSGTGAYSVNATNLTANTTYYVRAYTINSQGTAYGNEVTFSTSITAQSPTVTTTAPANITSNSATLGGNVTSAGSSAVLERGVVYATTQNPTTSNTKIASGSGTGAYTVNATNLTANTTYYVRAYAINSQGTAYGEQIEISTTQNSTITFIKKFNYTDLRSIISIDNGYITAANSSQGGNSVTISRLKTSGDIIWEVIVNNAFVEGNRLITKSSDGNLYIIATGPASPSNGEYAKLIKINLEGALVWTKTITNSGRAHSISSTSDGGIVITGFSGFTANRYEDIVLAKMDSEGNIIWVKNFGGSGMDYGNSVLQTTDGGFIVTGRTNSNDGDLKDISNGGEKMILIKTNHIGVREWVMVLDGIEGNSITKSNSNDYIITGSSLTVDGFGQGDIMISSVKSNGTINWTKIFGGVFGDTSASICNTSDGGFFLTGMTVGNKQNFNNRGNGEQDILIMKIDANGNKLWHNTFGGTGFDWGLEGVQTNDGGYVLVGIGGSTNGDFTGLNNGGGFIIKTNSTGNL